jgi:hypothetical protein
MPKEHHDARTSARIEAFLDGPPQPVRRRRAVRDPQRRPIVFDSPEAWHESLAREDQRVVRYGRPASVVVVDVAISHATPGTDMVEPVVEAIRHEARETDRVARVRPTRFHLLLPETGEAAATHLVDRLMAAWPARANGHAAAIRVTVGSASPGHGQRLADALAEAERQLEG